MSSVSITEIDMGWDDYVTGSSAIRDGKGAMDGHTGILVEAGLFDDGEDPNLAERGVWMELGTRDIDRRPWMSEAADQNQPVIERGGADAALQVIDGSDPDAAYQAYGNKVANLEREIILTDRVGGPALKPATVRAKGHAKKLVDSGEMVDSIEAEVTL